jgi:hypothetical protein
VKERDSRIKVIEMPRGEYLKHFARDRTGAYVGTETQRDWTEEELDLKFGMYKDAKPQNWTVVDSGEQVFMIEDNGMM